MAAKVLVAVLAATPFAAASILAFAVARWLPPARLGVPWWLWGGLLCALSTGTIAALDRLGRLVLPLASLLRLTLEFPDRTPSRFGVALRAFSTRQLERRIAEAQDGSWHDETIDDTPVDCSLVLLQLVAALSRHDRLTRGHCERVRAYTDLIVEEMGLSPDDASKLRWASLLHDIGKLTVPADLLSKQGALTDDEYEIVKTHAERGQHLCFPLAPWLEDWRRTIGEHHERWDGDGYPYGLAGPDIHLGARIVAVADTFDVITSARSYKKPLPAAAAREEISRCAGTQFDPAVVRAFLNIGISRLRSEVGLLSWLVSLAFVPSRIVAPMVLTGLLGVAATGAGLLPTISSESEEPTELAFTDELGPDEGDDGGADTDDTTTTTASGSPSPDDAEDRLPATGEPSTGAPAEGGPSTTSGEPTATPSQPTTTTTSAGAPTTATTTTTASGPATTTTTTTGPPTTTTTTTGAATTQPPNQAPTAAPDAAITNEDQTLRLSTVALLANDVDPDLDDLVVTSVSSFSGGTVSLSGSTIEFVPTPDHNGSAAFLYNISDGVDTATANVQITVLATPDDPVAVDDAFTTPQAVPLTTPAPGLLSNDSDPDGDDITVTSGPLLLPANGVVVVNGDGSITYTPNPLFTGDDTFTYEIADDTGRTDVATVTVTVG